MPDVADRAIPTTRGTAARHELSPTTRRASAALIRAISGASRAAAASSRFVIHLQACADRPAIECSRINWPSREADSSSELPWVLRFAQIRANTSWRRQAERRFHEHKMTAEASRQVVRLVRHVHGRSRGPTCKKVRHIAAQFGGEFGEFGIGPAELPRHSLARSKRAAASLLPPPMPACMGIRLVRWKCPWGSTPVRLASSFAARSTRLSSVDSWERTSSESC